MMAKIEWLRNKVGSRGIAILIGFILGFSLSVARAQPIEASPLHTGSDLATDTNVTTRSEGAAKADVSECGAILATEGDVDILDPSKTHLLGAQAKKALPCGSWISTRKGWLKFRHFEGAILSVGSYSLIQVLKELQWIVLMKGAVAVRNEDQGKTIRVFTSSTKAQISNGMAIVTFDAVRDHTQFIVLENSATLENRFDPDHVVTVQAGESSEMDLNLKRNVPSVPRAVSISSLYPKFLDLQILGKEQSKIVATILARQKKVYGSDILDDGEDQPQNVAKGATERESDKEVEKAEIHKQFEKKLTGGAPVSEEVFYPDSQTGKPNSARIIVEDPAESDSAHTSKMSKQELTEKKRLMHELSNLQSR